MLFTYYLLYIIITNSGVVQNMLAGRLAALRVNDTPGSARLPTQGLLFIIYYLFYYISFDCSFFYVCSVFIIIVMFILTLFYYCRNSKWKYFGTYPARTRPTWT
jgi:CDP-diglyceride synthetase